MNISWTGSEGHIEGAECAHKLSSREGLLLRSGDDSDGIFVDRKWEGDVS